LFLLTAYFVHLTAFLLVFKYEKKIFVRVNVINLHLGLTFVVSIQLVRPEIEIILIQICDKLDPSCLFRTHAIRNEFLFLKHFLKSLPKIAENAYVPELRSS